MTSAIKITSRDQLLNTLAEASELEHNLMCLYLFAYFSLKTKDTSDLSEEESQAIKNWAKTIKSIAIQEMGHLGMVANLTTAIGGTPNFFRPHFPVSPGNYPSDFVIELSPFSMALLEHFIFLERPVTAEVETSPEFEPAVDYVREAPKNRLMTHTGDYDTVGDLYQVITEGFERLTKTLGEMILFCGNTQLQLKPADMKMEGLEPIHDLESAKKILKVIVEQGEGSSCEDCHFNSFMKMKDEYEKLLKINPKFDPARACVKNPVMRRPAEESSTCVWVDEPKAAKYLDVGNSLYSLMLRLLVQIYSMEDRSQAGRKFLLTSAFKIMNALSQVGRMLPDFKASTTVPGAAGMSFSINRNFSPYELSSEERLIHERVQEIILRVEELESLDDVKKLLTEILKDIQIASE